jgi:hypothetical protein
MRFANALPQEIGLEGLLTAGAEDDVRKQSKNFAKTPPEKKLRRPMKSWLTRSDTQLGQGRLALACFPDRDPFTEPLGGLARGEEAPPSPPASGRLVEN